MTRRVSNDKRRRRPFADSGGAGTGTGTGTGVDPNQRARAYLETTPTTAVISLWVALTRVWRGVR